jgi:DNA-binding MarR family transcriptional regulator
MNTLEFLTRLSKHKVGVAEAATLFAAEGGKSGKQIAAITRTTAPTVKGRLGALRKKTLIHSRYLKDGTVIYSPTLAGQQIINQTAPKE